MFRAYISVQIIIVRCMYIY